MNVNTLQDRIRGSLIGGAIGDALGYPVEFMSLQAIKRKYGESGITRYDAGIDDVAHFSDDTQMTLFTANGYLFGETSFCMRGVAGHPVEYVKQAYLEWLQTQEEGIKDNDYHTCWIRDLAALNKNRAPGNTCISALQSLKDGMKVRNESKGCGGVMRVSPIGLVYAASVVRGGTREVKDVFQLGSACASITHKHPLGYLPAGYLSLLLFELCNTADNVSLSTFEVIIQKICLEMVKICSDNSSIRELYNLIQTAVSLAKGDSSDDDNIKFLGEGWTGDEALAIAIYCSLRHFSSFEKAVVAAVNHDGDSDSTGAICGNIMGVICGYENIPVFYKDHLELSDVILALADDLTQGCNISEYGSNDSPEQVQWMARYVDVYPYGFPHLALSGPFPHYPIHGVYEDIDDDALLKENVPEYFFFNDDAPESKHEEMLGLWWPCSIKIENVTYQSVGQFIEAEKARLFGKLKEREKILTATTRQEVLSSAIELEGFDADAWFNFNQAVGLYGNYHKFSQNGECRNVLMGTKDSILVYDSEDEYWGTGLRRTDKRIQNPDDWEWHNRLGFILMAIRGLFPKRTVYVRGTHWISKYVFNPADQAILDSLSSVEKQKEFKGKLIMENKVVDYESTTRTQYGDFITCGDRLVDFVPAQDNIVSEGEFLTLKNLIMSTEDIGKITDGLFENIEVVGDIEFSWGLEEIGKKGGEGVFKNCKFAKLYIPSEVTLLGDYAFAKCKIGVLKLYPSALKCKYGRQFKGASIEKLYLPENSLPMSCTDFGVLHSIVVNASVKEVYLDKFVHLSWEEFVKQI